MQSDPSLGIILSQVWGFTFIFAVFSSWLSLPHCPDFCVCWLYFVAYISLLPAWCRMQTWWWRFQYHQPDSSQRCWILLHLIVTSEVLHSYSLARVQPPAPSRVSYEIRPGCSRLHWVGSRKSPKMETVLLIWAAGFMACLFSRWPEVFPYTQLEPSSMWYIPFVSGHPTRHQGEEPCSFFSVTPYKTWKAGINKPASLSLSSQGTCYSLTRLFYIFNAWRI